MDIDDAVKHLVYRALKYQPRSTMDELHMLVITLAGRRIPEEDVARVVEHEILAGFISIDDKTGKIYIRIMLDPITEQHAGLWNYDDIAMSVTSTAVEEEPLPTSYIPENVNHLLHRGQGNAGTCTGQATAYIVDLLYLNNTEDYPESADKAMVRRNIRDKNTKYDVCYPQSFSAASLYYDGRRLGRVTVPWGGYIDYCLLAAKKEGVCRDWQWACPKDGVVNFIVPYPDIDPENGETCAETKKKHKIDGYATVNRDIESIKRAIYREGAVVGGYYMYDTLPYSVTNGVFENIGNRVIGAHAVTVVGWTTDGYLIILNSWWDENWPMLNFVSPRYHNAAAMYFMTAMQKESVKIARDMYIHVIVVTNRAAKIYIDEKLLGETTGGGSMGAELKRGVTYEFKAVCKVSGEVVTKSIRITSEIDYVVLMFKEPEDPIDPEEPVEPPKPGFLALFEKLQKKFDAIREKFKKLFGLSLSGVVSFV